MPNDKTILSRYDLQQLAKSFLGGEIIYEELNRAESKGANLGNTFNYPYGGRIPNIQKVLKLILGIEEPFGDEKDWQVKDRRREIIELARRDSSFIQIKAGDFTLAVGGKVLAEDKRLIREIAVHFGVPNADAWNLCKFPDNSSGYSDKPGELDPGFAILLEKEKPTWLEMAIDDRLEQNTREITGDPTGPENIVISLVSRRAQRLIREMPLTIAQEKAEQVLQAAEDKRKTAHEAWADFVIVDKKLSSLDLSQKSRKRPSAVAPSLSNINTPAKSSPETKNNTRRRWPWSQRQEKASTVDNDSPSL